MKAIEAAILLGAPVLVATGAFFLGQPPPDPLEERLIEVTSEIPVSPNWQDDATDVTDRICPIVGSDRRSLIAESEGFWRIDTDCCFLVVRVDADRVTCSASLQIDYPK